MIGVSNEVIESIFLVFLYLATIVCIIRSFINSSYIFEGYERRNWFQFGYGLITLCFGIVGTVLLKEYINVNKYTEILDGEVVFVFVSIIELLSLLIRIVIIDFQPNKVFKIGPYFGMKYFAVYVMLIMLNGVFNDVKDIDLCWYFVISQIVFKFSEYLKGIVVYGKNISDCREISGRM